MFFYCKKINQNTFNWNVFNITDMFYNCYKLTNTKLDGINKNKIDMNKIIFIF